MSDGLTETQDKLLCALDDAVEHLHWEFDASEYAGVGTCGFAHISGIDGRESFVRSMRSLAHSDVTTAVSTPERLDGFDVDLGGVEMHCGPDHDGGYRLSITNTRDLCHGPSYQRIDVQERLHRLIMRRLQFEWGYIPDAYVSSRVD